MFAIALRVLAGAQRRFRDLATRRAELEREVAH
jgi:hypothetical protein